jgi:hypothetical protein
VRWLTPSAGDVLFIAMLGLLSCTPLSVRLLGDAGIGWHIRTGQQILATHAIPRVDTFSSTMQVSPWFAWEWLYDLGVGTLERSAGLNGVVLFTAVIVAGVFAWAFRLMVWRGTSVLIAVVLILLAASASMIHFLARPHVLSWLFTVSWLAILDSSEEKMLCEEERRSGTLLWLLPPLMLLWVNVHGGWLIAFGLLAIYSVSALRTWLWTGKDKLEDILLRLRAARRAKELACVSIAAAAATLVNPYGWELHRHIHHYLSNQFLMDHIDEFQSPNFHGVAQRCFAALMLVAFVALGARARRVRLSEGLIVLFAVYSGLVASRNIPISSLLLAIVAGPLLTEAMQRVKWRRFWGRQKHLAGQPGAVFSTFSQRMSAVELSLRGHLWPIAAVVLLSWIAIHEGRLGSKQLMYAHFDGKRFPVAAVSFLERSASGEPVLSPDYWAGYLIFRLHPKVLVVADDRHDLYGEEFFKSYLKMIRLEPGWDTFIREHRVRRILMPRGSALVNLLVETPGWRTVYADDIAVLFESEQDLQVLPEYRSR